MLSSFILRIKKLAGKVNLPTSMSMFSAIPTGYWNDLSANLMLILGGLRVLSDNLAYSEYDIRLMLAPRSAKALQEKVLLKLHGIRKLTGSPSLGGTLFWIIAELSSLKKEALELCPFGFGRVLLGRDPEGRPDFLSTSLSNLVSRFWIED
nr:hypothetical protein [Tanacetum cinerariifolium]